MNAFSLRTLIDDILLIVRNNNISESEDFSRAQIAAWIMHYKANLLKQKLNEIIDDDADNDGIRDEYTKIVGPLKLTTVDSLGCTPLFKRETVKTIDNLFENSPHSIIAVYDQENCPIQYMHGQRRHFHYFRKYTSRELTYNYNVEDKKIIIQGTDDCGALSYIWVKYIAEDNTDDVDEDDVKIPGWMIPAIKELIFKNELSFMIKMPSDDDNNSTLDGIKPHGPQDQEK